MFEALSSFLDTLRSGGWTMVPLILCSLTAVTIIIEKFLYGPTKARALPRDFEVQALTLAKVGKVEELYRISQQHTTPAARIIQSIIGEGTPDRESLERAAALQGRKEIEHYERFISILGSIAAVGPLLGLLGTIFGMIDTFHVISGAGAGNPKMMAGGISEALVSTATGLTVAIPSLLFFRFFQGRVKSVTNDLEFFSEEIVGYLSNASEVRREANAR
jgi:biopolymer transport protein ExbB